MKNHLLLILATSALLVACGSGEANSSANSSGEANSSTGGASSSSSFSFSEQSISSTQSGSEITSWLAKQKAISALKKAADATMEADALKITSSNGKFKTNLKGNDIPFEFEDEEGNKIDKTASGSLYLNTANLSLSVSAKNLSSKDASQISGYAEISGDMEMTASGEIADSIGSSSLASANGTYSGRASAKGYLSNDWAYGDFGGVNSWLVNNGFKELTTTKYKANVTETKEYIESLKEDYAPSSSEETSSSSFDWSGSNLIRILGLMCKETHAYQIDDNTQEVTYLVDYGLFKSELSLVSYGNESIKKLVDNLPSAEDVTLENSTVYFLFTSDGIVSSGINFKGEIKESNKAYYGTFEAVHNLAYSYDEASLDIKIPEDPSSFKDVTPKKDSSTGE